VKGNAAPFFQLPIQDSFQVIVYMYPGAESNKKIGVIEKEKKKKKKEEEEEEE
jgi:hypothetical protein